MTGSGGYMGFSASVTLDVSKFQESVTDASKFAENKVEFSSGGPDLPEPIGLKLIPIPNAITDSFFSTMSQSYRCEHLDQRRSNVQRVLREYPNVKGVSPPQGMISLFKQHIKC